MPFVATNPSTTRYLYSVPSLDAAARHALLGRIAQQQRTWRSCTREQRAQFVEALGHALTRHRETLALSLTTEMGKPLSAARGEVDKCIHLCEVAPTLSANALHDDVLFTDGTSSAHVRYEAIGVVLAIMPWNFPLWQALRCAVPCLLAGNGVLIKPAPSVPGAARLLADCLHEARDAVASHAVPPAPCDIIFCEQDDIAELIADARIAAVTLTGSDRAGRRVGALAGAALKKVVLELGGSDAFIVLPDADVERAAVCAVQSRTVNGGQSCIAAKRFIVCDAIYAAFVERFSARMQALTVGDPFAPDTDVGPLATAAARTTLERQVRESVALGARVACTGVTPDLPGYYYAPTVLVDVPWDSPAATEELFGPVAAVFRVHTVDDAITRANATSFGLGASIWTSSTSDASRCIAELDVGMVFINEMVVSDARTPFGGVKQSGMGRELGALGFREFTNPKLVRSHHLPSPSR